MVMIQDPSRLNRRISFGENIPQENGNGITLNHADSNFRETFSLWCGVWKRTLAEQFQVIGTEHQNDLTVIIRHNPAVNDKLLAQMNGITYRVLDVLPDESPTPVSFDLVTMKRVTK